MVAKTTTVTVAPAPTSGGQAGLTRTAKISVAPAGNPGSPGVPGPTRTLKITVAPAGGVVGRTKRLTISVGAYSQSKTKTQRISVVPSSATIVAGPNRTTEAGELITLSPQTETAGSAAIVSRQWTQAGAVIGATKTVTVLAPITRNGVAVPFVYTVTDASGVAQSSSLTVNVFPAPLRGVNGVPMIQRAY